MVCTRPVNSYNDLVLKQIVDDVETSDHLFFQWMFAKALWSDIHDWLHTNIRLEPFSQQDIIYRIVMDIHDWDFLINNVLIL